MRHASRLGRQTRFGVILARTLAAIGLLIPLWRAQAQIPPRPAVRPGGLTIPSLPPPGSPLPELEPRVAPSLAPGLPRPPAPTPPLSVTGGPDHTVARVTVDGITAYPAGVIERLTQGLTGTAIPKARIEAAR